MRKQIGIIILVFLCLDQASTQQCTSNIYERCLCISTSPYCTCSALTQTNTLNFSSNYASHLVAVSSQGCRPCASNCLKCSTLSNCTQCLPCFELQGGQCQGCPLNCQTCSNSICTSCISGYYLDYQSICQICPITGTAVCTINSLQSCLSNYWLDNNAANCIQCDQNCQQCSSTTKCAICTQGFYLQPNYTCSTCQQQCLQCSDSTSCQICLNSSLYFNTTSKLCVLGARQNCFSHFNFSNCSICNDEYYLSEGTCISVPQQSKITGCNIYGLNSNKIISCRNCSIGLFNTTNACYFGCSNLCTSCFGPHYGLCYGCVSSAYLYNMHCIPIYNRNKGASFQLFYTAFNNPTFFSGTNVISSGCILQTISGSNQGKIRFSLNGLQSDQINLKWKVYIYNIATNVQSINYVVAFNNSQNIKTFSFHASYSISKCSGSDNLLTFIDKSTVTITQIIKDQNIVEFSAQADISIGLSQVLVIANRCGGIQGTSCLQCTSTSTCTKCVNSNYFIQGPNCVISCPSNYYIRTSTKTCLLACVPGTYTENNNQLCLECQYPCLTCSSPTTCLSCANGTYFFNQFCFTECPSGYYPNRMRKSCEPCIRPCFTCLSNIQCLSCIYGFYQNQTKSCILKCPSGYFGNLFSLSCQKCIQPCNTCASNIGSQCLSCVPLTYLYASSCLTQCPEGFFQNNVQCLPCDSNCASCSSYSNCTSCPQGTYLLNSTCQSYCPSTFFEDGALSLCKKCKQHCSQCINSEFCESCMDNFSYYSANYSCLLNCPALFYSKDNICYSCQTPCYQCQSDTYCLSCKGLFLYQGTCLSNCPSKYFGDTSLMACLPCNSTICKQCLGTASKCLSCNSNLIFFNYSCFENCPDGYYLEPNASICLNCKQNCRNCINISACILCRENYIQQNGNCLKVCQQGYYKIIVNYLAKCQKCPTGCSSCKSEISLMQCTGCLPKYFILNGNCVQSCGDYYYESNRQCQQCVVPCEKCTSQRNCMSCMKGLGYLFNQTCLNSCPLGYFQNQTVYQCQRCASHCLSCIDSADKCTSCGKSLYLFINQCLSNCPQGYYLSFNSNVCFKCNNQCFKCLGSPSNCTLCNDKTKILISGNCINDCPQGFFLKDMGCTRCSSNCSKCLSDTICIQCRVNYFLNPHSECLSYCPTGYFSLNGVCAACNYPCRTCANYQTCLSCQIGYISSGNCVSQCSAPTFLNVSSLACESCPGNCSNCKSPTECLECLSGVLVDGVCQSQCPLGFFDYYRICAPCMYGCLNCSDSATCNFCYIGYLYNGICLQFCPIGWVSSNSSSPRCQQCINGCLKCIVQANHCTLCSSGLFLYLFTCVHDCPRGTYKHYKSKTCITCKSPCQTCINGYSCLTCLYGYLLYSQRSGNQCIEGNICPNSFYLNKVDNTCVYQCPNNTYVDHKRYVCSYPCEPTYVLLKKSLQCLQFCPTGMWVSNIYQCEQGNAPVKLLLFTCKPLILRNILVIDCTFSHSINNMASLTLDQIKISNYNPIQIFIVNNFNIRIIVDTPIGEFRDQSITLQILNRYQLYSNQYYNQQNITTVKNYRNLEQTYSMPLQNSNTSFLLKQFLSYTDEQRQTGMQLFEISQSICIGAFIFWFFSILKNLKSTSLSLILIIQWIYSLSLIDTSFAPNLGLFLEGFKLSNLFFSNKLNEYDSIWKINSQYRQNLWGITDLFEFNAVFLPSIILTLVFAFIYLFTLIAFKQLAKSKEKMQEQDEKSQKIQQGEQKYHQPQQAKSKGDQYEKAQQSIFSDVPSKKEEKQQISKKSIKNILDASNIPSNYSHLHKKNCESKLSINKRIKEDGSYYSNNSNKEKKEQQEKKVNWDESKRKFGLKFKIINDRFYYNYCLQCILITASPLSIGVCCQIISSNVLSFTFSLFFFIWTSIIIFTFIRVGLSEQKMYVTTKYWFIMYLETMLQNGMAIICTSEIYMGVMLLMLIINLYVWNRMFSSKKSKQYKHFFIFNDLLRIVIIIEAIVGYTNKHKWTGETFYNYSWVFIMSLLILIIAAAIQITKQLFQTQEHVKATETKIGQSKENSNSQPSTLSSKLDQLLENEQQQQKDSQREQTFFSQHKGQESQSDDDIIDFDQISKAQKNAPKQLIRYDKERY